MSMFKRTKKEVSTAEQGLIEQQETLEQQKLLMERMYRKSLIWHFFPPIPPGVQLC